MTTARAPGQFPNLGGVRHIVLVLSGKGGVGKSSVTTQLALSLHHRGLKVGVLDIDLCGPSIPKMFGLDAAQIRQSPQGWVVRRATEEDRLRDQSPPSWIPAYADAENRLSVMSIQFLLPNKDDAIVWRGPKKNGGHRIASLLGGNHVR